MSQFLFVVIPNRAVAKSDVDDALQYTKQRCTGLVPHNLLAHLRLNLHASGCDSHLEPLFGAGALYPSTKKRLRHAETVLQSLLLWARSKNLAPYVLLEGHKRSLPLPAPETFEMAVEEIFEFRAALPFQVQIVPSESE